MSNLIRSAFILTSAIFFGFAVVSAEERITRYTTDIEVKKSGELIIDESIVVNAEGNKIRRGIYRDFPTLYRDNYGHKYSVAFDIIAVSRDGLPEKFHTERRVNGVRVYIGDKDRLVPSGRHQYHLKFRTDRQIGFFKEHDELYFNAIGHGWEFPILEAYVSVRLPAEVRRDSIWLDGYTGSSGETAKEFTTGLATHENLITFRTTDILSPYEGFTIVVGWEKGVIAEPTFTENLRFILRDNYGLIVGIFGLIAAFTYYLIAWHFAGRDPRKGAIFPQWKAPKNLSPAETAYLRGMGFNKKIFATHLIDMAVRGLIKIEHSDLADSYILIKEAALSNPSVADAAIIGRLFGGADQIEIKQENHSNLRAAINILSRDLRKKHLKKTFYSNVEFMLPGLFIMAIAYFFIAEEASFNMDNLINLGNFIILICFLVMHVVFRHLLKAPTREGRKLMDQIEGLKLYMTMAEEPTMAAIKDINEAPQFFEKLLPYAFALGVENDWCAKFESAFKQLEERGQGYSPRWHSGFRGSHGFNARDITKSLSSGFSSRIASSSVAPGSQSGSGGGGFSGGGGGGGGGGGW